MEQKIDGKKLFRELYSPPRGRPVIVEVPELPFLVVQGSGEPAGEAFRDAIGALYTLVYTLRFLRKRRPGPAIPAFTVMPLEALWWAQGREGMDLGPRDVWEWQAMIMLPPFASEELVAEAAEEVRARGKETPASGSVRLERWEEGLAVQLLHLGPYADEPPSIERMHSFAREQGYEPHGRHHEIYLSDPGRTPPEKLKTVLRQPLRPAAQTG